MATEEMEIMKIKSAFNPALSAQLTQSLQQDKTTVKTSYVFVNARKQFLKSLYMEPSDWLTTEEAEEELQEATAELQDVKMEIKDVKETMVTLCESAEEGYVLLTQRESLLEKKIKELEEKKSELDQQRAQFTAKLSDDDMPSKSGKEIIADLNKKIRVVEEAIMKCHQMMTHVKNELQDMELVIRDMEQTLSSNSENINKLTRAQEDKKTILMQLIENLENHVNCVEQLGGVKVIPLSSLALRVEFPTPSTEQSGVQLALSLEFFENNLGHLILKSAELNIDSIDVSEMIHEALAHNDVPRLVTKLKSRWLSHQPLLSEVSDLRLRSAVDWIQEDNMMRVMVGHGGSIVCTLNIPPTYPLSGEVTLGDIKQHAVNEDISQLQPVGSERTLTAWVNFLEAKFGRP